MKSKTIANREARRRVVLHLGLAAVFATSMTFVATACIFDQGGKYEGGGRLGQAATANQQPVGSSSSSSSGGDDDDQNTQNSSSSSSSSGFVVLPDGGLADAH